MQRPEILMPKFWKASFGEKNTRPSITLNGSDSLATGLILRGATVPFVAQASDSLTTNDIAWIEGCMYMKCIELCIEEVSLEI